MNEFQNDVEQKRELSELEKELARSHMRYRHLERVCFKLYENLQKKDFQYQILRSRYADLEERNHDRLFMMVSCCNNKKDRTRLQNLVKGYGSYRQRKSARYRDVIFDDDFDGINADFSGISEIFHESMFQDDHRCFKGDDDYRYLIGEGYYGRRNTSGRDSYYYF